MVDLETFYARMLGKEMALDLDRWVAAQIKAQGRIPSVIISGKHEIHCEIKR